MKEVTAVSVFRSGAVENGVKEGKASYEEENICFGQ